MILPCYVNPSDEHTLFYPSAVYRGANKYVKPGRPIKIRRIASILAFAGTSGVCLTGPVRARAHDCRLSFTAYLLLTYSCLLPHTIYVFSPILYPHTLGCCQRVTETDRAEQTDIVLRVGYNGRASFVNFSPVLYVSTTLHKYVFLLPSRRFQLNIVEAEIYCRF